MKKTSAGAARLWQKPKANAQQVDKSLDEFGSSIYLEAYHYALDLCDNPAIARAVASRFSKSWEAQEQSVTEFTSNQA